MVRTPHVQCRDPGSILGQGTKIPHVLGFPGGAATAAAAKSLQSCLTLCDPVDCSQPGSSVHGLLQARILQWVLLWPPGDLADPGIESVSYVSHIGRQVHSQ